MVEVVRVSATAGASEGGFLKGVGKVVRVGRTVVELERSASRQIGW